MAGDCIRVLKQAPVNRPSWICTASAELLQSLAADFSRPLGTKVHFQEVRTLHANRPTQPTSAIDSTGGGVALKSE